MRGLPLALLLSLALHVLGIGAVYATSDGWTYVVSLQRQWVALP